MSSREIVLLVDDDVVFRDFLRFLLQEQGFQTIEATDGQEVKALLNAGVQVDLIVTDIVMPRCDGIEMIQAIRKMLPGLPIIAISGALGTDDYLLAAKCLGADAAMDKLMVYKNLLGVIETLLRQPQAHA